MQIEIPSQRDVLEHRLRLRERWLEDAERAVESAKRERDDRHADYIDAREQLRWHKL